MSGPEQERNNSPGERSLEFDKLWSQLVAPAVLPRQIEALRQEFIIWLAQPEFEARTDCSQGEGASIKLTPLTAFDRQQIAILEERFEAMLSDAAGGDMTTTVVARFGYTDQKGESIHSILVRLADSHDLPVLYDGHTASVNCTHGAGLTEVLLGADDAISIRLHLSVETIQYEIGQIASDWPAYFKLTGDRKTSPLLSAAWAQARTSHEAFQEFSRPDSVTLYTGADSQVFHLRFDIADHAVVVTIACSGCSLRPGISNFMLERPVLDASLTRIRPEMNEQGTWDFAPDRLLSPDQRDVFSSTIRSLYRRTRDWDSYMPSIYPAPPQMPFVHERMLHQYFFRAGELEQKGQLQIDHFELLTRSGRNYLAAEGRWAVGILATTREGQFVLNTSYTRTTFEYGPAGVILLGNAQKIDRILPFYSQAAFREELGRLLASDATDLERLRQESYLLHLTIGSSAGAWALEPGAIERTTVTFPGSSRDCAEIRLFGALNSCSATISRSPASGLVETVSPYFPTLRQFGFW